MDTVVGPVVMTEGRYAFDIWTPERGLSRSFHYPCVGDAYYARRFEIGRARRQDAVSCDTLDEFDLALAERCGRHERLAA